MNEVEPNLDIIYKIIPTSNFLSKPIQIKSYGEACRNTFESLCRLLNSITLEPKLGRVLTTYSIKLAYDAMEGFPASKPTGQHMEVILEAIGSGLISNIPSLKYCMEKLGVELWHY